MPQGRSKLRSSVSLPRKSTVPWQRYAEEAAAAQGELYAIRPLEKVTLGGAAPGPAPTGLPPDACPRVVPPQKKIKQHGRLIEALGKEVAESREKLRRAEARAGELEAQQRGLRQEQGQHRQQLERLRQQLEEANARVANLGARWVAPKPGGPQRMEDPKGWGAPKPGGTRSLGDPKALENPKPWRTQSLGGPEAWVAPNPGQPQSLGDPKAVPSAQLGTPQTASSSCSVRAHPRPEILG